MSRASADLTPAPPLTAAFVEHHGFVRARLRGLGVADADLDDATQDVFEVLVRRIADYDPRQPLRGWLAGIARRVARRYRERGRRSVVPLDERRLADNGSPEDQAARAEARQLLREFIATLEPERWSVFVLSEIEGLRGTEIAAELELNLDTVYARLRSARKEFERTLRRHRARQRRGRWGLLPIWAGSRDGSPSAWPIAAMGTVLLGSLALVTVLDPHCRVEGYERGSARAPTEARAASVRSEQGVAERPSDPAASTTAVAAQGWREQMSMFERANAAGERFVLEVELRHRLEADRVLLELVFIGDDDVDIDSFAGHITTDDFELVEGSSDWDIRLPAGKTHTLSLELRAFRAGVVGFRINEGWRRGEQPGGSRQLRFVFEAGVLRACEPGECQAPEASAEQLSGETIAIELANDCDVPVDFVLFAASPDQRPPTSAPVHSIGPGERRTMRIDAAQWFFRLDAEGQVGGGAHTDRDGGRVRFFSSTGTSCDATSASEPPPYGAIEASDAER